MHRHFNKLSCTDFMRCSFLLLIITELIIISSLSSNASYAEEQETSSWETTLMQAAACVEWDLDQLHFEACDPEGGPPINVYSSYLVPVSARITCPNTEYCSAAEAASNSRPGYVEISGILSPPTTSCNLPWAMPGALFRGTNSFSSPVIIKFDTSGLGEFTGLAHISRLYTDMTIETMSLTLKTKKQYNWIQPNPDKIAKNYQVTVNLGGIAKPKSPILHIRSEVEIIDKCAEWSADTDTVTHCPGVTFEICNSDLGIRIRRIKNGEVGYIAGCYYAGGQNYHLFLHGLQYGVLWINLKPDPNNEDKYLIADAYRYDCQSDKVQKSRHYPEEGYEGDPVDKKDAWEMMQEYGLDNNCLKSADLPPPANSEDLNNWISTGEPQLIKPTAIKTTAENETYVKSISPLAFLNCYYTNETDWEYALVVDETLTKPVSPGDLIVFEGSGIAGGSVKGDASKQEFGGWKVSENTPSKVVFEATVEAKFTIAKGFVIKADECTTSGQVACIMVGDWIGVVDLIPGPIPNIIYVEGAGSCGGKTPCYSSIQSAIDASPACAEMRIAGGTYTEVITLNASKSLTLQGGWDTSFKNQTGTTTLQGAPKAQQGSLTLQNLRILPR